MSAVLLVRHGQATFGLGTYDRLSEHGQQQARHLGEVLAQRGVAVDRVVSGDLERQRETAALLAEALGTGLVPGVDPRWNEYDHLPLIARVKPMYRKQWLMVADLARSGNPNRKLQEILDEALLRWIADDDAAHEDGAETFAGYRGRIAEVLDEISGEAGVSVVVSSAGTIAAAVAPLIGVPPAGWPDLQRVVVNSSVTKVVRGRRGISLVSFNEHGHLEGVPGLTVTYR